MLAFKTLEPLLLEKRQTACPVGCEAKDCPSSLAFAGLEHVTTLLVTFPLKAQALLPLVSLLLKQRWANLVPDPSLQ